MDIIDNQGEKVGSLTNAVSNDQSITINRPRDVTMVSTRDRNTGSNHGDIRRGSAVWQLRAARPVSGSNHSFAWDSE
jgi:hypothetical protein